MSVGFVNPPPGGLSPADTPQFVQITFDDSVTPLMYERTQTLIEGLENPGGCPISLTYFISMGNGAELLTDPDLVTRLFRRGHEISTHTFAHTANPGAEEIEAAREWLVREASIPRSHILGFRAPFLSFTPETFDHLNNLGFLYDSSVSEQSGRVSSPNVNNYIWPHELSGGFRLHCVNNPCDEGRPRPGLWEVPMISMRNPDGSIAMPMDPVVTGEEATFQLLWNNFMHRYSGNRAPFGIHLHLSWIYDPTHVAALQRFIRTATEMGDVYFANNLQMLGWIQNPVPSSQYAYDCSHVVDDPDAGLCAPPVNGCMFGTWDEASCSCLCFTSLCPDSTGSCAVQATWTASGWSCEDDDQPSTTTTWTTTPSLTVQPPTSTTTTASTTTSTTTNFWPTTSTGTSNTPRVTTTTGTTTPVVRTERPTPTDQVGGDSPSDQQQQVKSAATGLPALRTLVVGTLLASSLGVLF